MSDMERRRADELMVGDVIEIDLVKIVEREIASITEVGKMMGTEIPVLRFEFTVVRGIKALEVAADQLVNVASI